MLPVELSSASKKTALARRAWNLMGRRVANEVISSQHSTRALQKPLNLLPRNHLVAHGQRRAQQATYGFDLRFDHGLSNNPSSGTRPTRRHACNQSAMAVRCGPQLSCGHIQLFYHSRRGFRSPLIPPGPAQKCAAPHHQSQICPLREVSLCRNEEPTHVF